MSPALLVRDLRPERGVDLRLFRRILCVLLEERLSRKVGELAIYLVDRAEMTRLNEAFLRHSGPTDVITFDYSEPGAGPSLYGEIFICLPVARAQAQKFKVTWQSELIRYAVHGVLHLCGHDDQTPPERARMKRAENNHLRGLAARFDLGKLAFHKRR